MSQTVQDRFYCGGPTTSTVFAANLQAQRKWTSVSNLGSSPGTGRGLMAEGSGTNVCWSVGTGEFMEYSPPAGAYTSVVFGVAANTVPANTTFAQVYDASGNLQCYCAFDSSRRVEVRSAAGVLIATGTTSFSSGTTYNYAEVGIALNSGSSGFVVIGGNGAQETTASGATGAGSTPTSFGKIKFLGGSGPTRFQDFYIHSGTVSGSPSLSYNTDCLGDIRVMSRIVTADTGGGLNQWDATGTGSHFDEVASPPTANPSASYVYTATAGEEEFFEITDIASTQWRPVIAVQLHVSAYKDGAGATVTVAPEVRYSGTTVTGTSATTTTSPRYYKHVYTTAPGGGSWDAVGNAVVNATSLGVKLVSIA